MAMQNMCKYATYSTDKISSSYLFVFCVRLKTFQPPLVHMSELCLACEWITRHDFADPPLSSRYPIPDPPSRPR